MDSKYYTKLCPHNTVAIQLFRLKLSAILPTLPKELLVDPVLKHAIITYADTSLLLQIARISDDAELRECAASKIRPRIVWPQERWNPENFMISAAKLDTIGEEPLAGTNMLKDMAKFNDDETCWLNKNLLPHLHEKSTFNLTKPMVLHMTHEEKQDLNYDDDIERVVIAIIDQVSPEMIEQLVKNRMKPNTLVCLALFICQHRSHWATEFCEWLSSKLQVPLLVYDFQEWNLSRNEIAKIVLNAERYEMEKEKIWQYNLVIDTPVTYTEPVKVITEVNKGEKGACSTETYSFLNGRNIPFIIQWRGMRVIAKRISADKI